MAMGNNVLQEVKDLNPLNEDLQELKDDAIAMLVKLKEFEFIQHYDVKGNIFDIDIDDNTSWVNDGFDTNEQKIGMAHSFIMGFYVSSCILSEKHKFIVDAYQRRLKELQDTCEKNKNLIIVP